MRRIERLLRLCVERGGSDLHFKTDTSQVYIRISGELIHLEEEPPFPLTEFQSELYALLKPSQIQRFEKDLELDFALEIADLSRFRGNAYQQKGHLQAVFRVIPYELQTMEDLQLPGACYDFVERPRGLVLVTGPTGSGKSTSLAAMIDRINRTQPVHIMTVEDPIEFVHDDHMAIVNQRELEVDTMSFANALKYVLRQDPDVILVGEMRDLETIHLAITAAETGHLVFATLHTVDAVQTVDRIIDVFPAHQQQQVRMQLSVNLVGVLSQTLLRRADGRGRQAAFETLVATGAVRNLIRENKTYQVTSLIQTGARAKMQTLDQSLASLVERGVVSFEDAKLRAKDPGEFGRLVSLNREAQQMAYQNAVKQGLPPPVAPQGAAPTQPGFNKGQPAPTQEIPGNISVPPAPGQGVRGQPNRPSYRKE